MLPIGVRSSTGRPRQRHPQSVPSGGYTIWVNGAERTRLRDAYHTFLRLPWSASLALIALGFFLVNVVFAVVYY